MACSRENFVFFHGNTILFTSQCSGSLNCALSVVNKNMNNLYNFFVALYLWLVISKVVISWKASIIPAKFILGHAVYSTI